MCQKIEFVLDSAHDLLKIAMDGHNMINLSWPDDIHALSDLYESYE